VCEFNAVELQCAKITQILGSHHSEYKNDNFLGYCTILSCIALMETATTSENFFYILRIQSAIFQKSVSSLKVRHIIHENNIACEFSVRALQL
jgi:hypothetical protein